LRNLWYSGLLFYRSNLFDRGNLHAIHYASRRGCLGREISQH